MYNQALEMEESQRTAFLREACAGDDDLRRQLEKLLAQDPGSFLEEPALQGIAREFGATPAASWIGRRIGNYEFLSLVGAGGMGEVYRAHDTKLKREVAIKILPDEFARDPERVSRFQREAQLLASLNHPNIAAIYDLEEDDGFRFLILELVEGETLAERLKRGPIPVDDALKIAAQIAEGLGAAHDRGIVHRDLKPANIKLRRDGKVKVLDFGLAKAFSGDRADLNPANSPTKMTATLPGMIMGTAAYMSPEHANGKETERTTDVWAFGCVLYEMLAGHRAFEGETIAQILGNVMKAAPDWTRLPDGTPAGVRRLLRRCLRKEEKFRLRDLRDARLEIDDAQTEPNESEPAAPAPPRSRHRLAWIVSLAVAVAITAFAVSYFRATAGSPEMRLEISTTATSDPASFAISPDGRLLVFAGSGEGGPQLWLRRLDAATAQPLPGTEGASRPFWSPDSRSVAFFADNKLKRIAIGGGLPHMIEDHAGGGGGTWGPGDVILFARGGTLFRIPAIGGQSVPVTKLDAPRQTDHRLPHFLPGGRQFLFFAAGLPETQGIYLGSLDSMETHRLTAADTAGAYLPPGWLLFFRQGTFVAQRFDLTRGELTGEPVTVADSVEFDGGLTIGAFSVSTTGMVAYRVLGERQLTWFDRSGNQLGAVGAPDKNDLGTVELSPDGSRAAATRTVESNRDIFLLDAARMTRFTFEAGTDWFPIFSPDGSRIVFGSDRNGHNGLYEKPTNGAAGTETPFIEGSRAPNDWSRDGRFILYGTGSGLWVQQLDENGKLNGKPREFFKKSADERWGQFSPDGHWVAYQSNGSGRYEIYVRPFPGPGEPRMVSDAGGIQARWGPVGSNELYYIAPEGKLMAVKILVKGAVLDPGPPVPLFQTRIFGLGAGVLYKQHYDVAPDGRFLIVVDNGSPITILLNWKPPGSPGNDRGEY
jgi:serine/threonine protein kinase